MKYAHNISLIIISCLVILLKCVIIFMYGNNTNSIIKIKELNVNL